MEAKTLTKRELLKQWKCIELEDNKGDVAWADSSKQNIFQLKTQWFSDAFNFLFARSQESHIWCGHSELMVPLMEIFYNYFKDGREDSPLKLLWTRISQEMRKCTQCTVQHHQAQGMYSSEFESCSVGILLDVLKCLDEGRVSDHLKDINSRLRSGHYLPACDDVEIVSLMFEVLMFPALLDDDSLQTEFQLFVEAVDSMHELALTKDQQYPGVYALFFLKSPCVRSIARRLAGFLGKIRTTEGLDPLQPLLKKCISFLDTENIPVSLDSPRQRMQLETETVWNGIHSLIGFLEPPAFEQGILEEYPFFLTILLNHISDESHVFLHALKCLKRVIDMLGCKLWLNSSLSPNVMQNRLISQCFHTRNEKTHKEIFDLFLPFLQSLEALQDAEHEDQRRHFLFFLLHQVPVSSNFSILMRKKARQIALFIVHRGYSMNPPSPPFECAHMWCPSLVLSLKDSSLHASLQQPAFDLIQTIIVSDAAALIMPFFALNRPSNISYYKAYEFDIEGNGCDFLFPPDNESDTSPWGDYDRQGKICSVEYKHWMCIPMLWHDVFTSIEPSIFPTAFAKAVFWCRSRLSTIEPESDTGISAVPFFLSHSGPEISSSFEWQIPSGSDDGHSGKGSRNSVKMLTMHVPLVRMFKRLAGHFMGQMKTHDLMRRWIWQPMMSESLILLLFDSNDSVRHIAKCILEQISNTRGLTSGLHFLSSCTSSLSAVFLGLDHALKLFQVDSSESNFLALHNFNFLLCKILKEGFPQTSSSPSLHFSSEGGFLRQPVSERFFPCGKMESNVDLSCWKKFCFLLSKTAWPFLCECLIEGKAFIDDQRCQMACVRVLEIVPVVLECLLPLIPDVSFGSTIWLEKLCDFSWFNTLVEWGKSSLEVLSRYWKQSLTSSMALLERYLPVKDTSVFSVVRNLILKDNAPMDDIAGHMRQLSCFWSFEASHYYTRSNSKSDGLSFCDMPTEVSMPFPTVENALHCNQVPESVKKQSSGNTVIVLSDDETDGEIAGCLIRDSAASVGNSVSASIVAGGFPTHSLLDSFPDNTKQECLDRTLVDNFFDSLSEDKSPIRNVQDASAFLHMTDGKENSAAISSVGHASRALESTGKIAHPQHADVKCAVPSSENGAHSPTALSLDPKDDHLERCLDEAREQRWHLLGEIKSSVKRKVIRLTMPVETRSGSLYLSKEKFERFKPRNLDDWFRTILEMDYFETVGLSDAKNNGSRKVLTLKEVPIHFDSCDHYIDIFRPLVFEEFKAQLRSSFHELSRLEDTHHGSASIVSLERIDDFHIVRCMLNANEDKTSKSFMENDLVLLTKQQWEKSSNNGPHLLGKMERKEMVGKGKSNILNIKLFLQSGCPHINQSRKLFLVRSKWFVSRIMSMTSHVREFQALSSMKHIPLHPSILKPRDNTVTSRNSCSNGFRKLNKPLQKMLKSAFNASQIQAISAVITRSDSTRNHELSLVQGPPGTGKTRTIVAIISALLCASRMASRGEAASVSSCVTSPKSTLITNVAIARAWQDAALAKQMIREEEGATAIGSTRRRVLVCAQSNAAVDELVSRIVSHGLYGSDGDTYNPFLVRVGNPNTVHPGSMPFFIDTLIDQKLAPMRGQPDLTTKDGDPSTGSSPAALRANLERLVERIRYYEVRHSNLKNNVGGSSLSSEDGVEMTDNGIGQKLSVLHREMSVTSRNLASAQSRERKANEEMRVLKKRLRTSILREAEVIVATLSGCGGDLYGVCSESSMGPKLKSSVSEDVLFDAVIIDEAAQALEPATLIPLQLLKSTGTRCIMVGDPKQLPATVLSNVASKYHYQCSMFERLQKAGSPVVMLTQQDAP